MTRFIHSTKHGNTCIILCLNASLTRSQWLENILHEIISAFKCFQKSFLKCFKTCSNIATLVRKFTFMLLTLVFYPQYLSKYLNIILHKICPLVPEDNCKIFQDELHVFLAIVVYLPTFSSFFCFSFDLPSNFLHLSQITESSAECNILSKIPTTK